MKTKNRPITDSYFELVKRFPLRAIRTAAEHRQALAIVQELVRNDERLDSGEGDYLQMLAGIVQSYERVHFPVGNVSPLEMLKHLMEARDMRPADLGKLIGASAATMVLKGDREMSKSHIRKLAEFFHVSPAVFI